MTVHKVVLRSVLPALKRLPHRVADSLLGTMGRLDLVVVPRQAERYRAAVARAASRLGCDWDVSQVSRSLARQSYRWRTRDFLLDNKSPDQVSACFDVKGREHLDAAMARGKGVILLANHFGSHILTSHWLFRERYPLRWFSERPRSVSAFMAEQFKSEGPLGQDRMFISRRSTPADAASSILRAARVLSAGMVVKVACDVRWSGNHTVKARFLGQDTEFSKTWVTLAAMTGATVIPVFCRRDEGQPYRLEFGEGYVIPDDASKGGRDLWWVQDALTRVEEQVRLHPEQSNDYFFWDDSETLAA